MGIRQTVGSLPLISLKNSPGNNSKNKIQAHHALLCCHVSSDVSLSDVHYRYSTFQAPTQVKKRITPYKSRVLRFVYSLLVMCACKEVIDSISNI